MKRDVAGIILAGGQSRRMGGGDKSLLPLGAGCVLDLVLSRLGPQIETLALGANGDPARFSRFGLAVLADTVEGFAGPLAGILTGLEWAVASTPCKALPVCVPSLTTASGGADATTCPPASPPKMPTCRVVWLASVPRSLAGRSAVTTTSGSAA